MAAPKRKPRVDDMPSGPLQADELHAIWLPRKHLEVWYETRSFERVVVGTLVRCSQILNNQRTFFAAYVMGTKRGRMYKLGAKTADVALQVRTATGNRLVGLDALSNDPLKPVELDKFKVPLDPDVVRKKLRSLQRAMSEDAELFDEADRQARYEVEERMRAKREEEARVRQQQEEAEERKEREREEVRRRAQGNKGGSEEAWWLQYQTSAGDKQREIAKVRARLLRFRKIAESSTAEGERENAMRLAEQAEAKLAQLTEDQGAEEDE